ncbi:MAG: hypothetical protein IPK04_08280 [Bdellovibrionales bacterium]|nr:hypothetical protein [Bdellovibrionales bacterium]
MNSYFNLSSKYAPPNEDHPIFLGNYGIGGPGRRGFGFKGMVQGISSAMLGGRGMDVRSDSVDMLSPNSPEAKSEQRISESVMEKQRAMDGKSPASSEVASVVTELRTNFSETAFFYPNLISGKNGEVEIKFKVPESVTSWTLWLQGLTRDLKSATASRQAETVKELLVRPYLPRFLREGDRAQLRFVLNNTSDKAIYGQVRIELLDEDGKTDLASKFHVKAVNLSKPFNIEAGKSFTHEIELTAPVGLGNLVVRAVAKAGNLSDGEQRSLPILPGRFHLAQSKFVPLKNTQAKTLEFSDLKSNTDSSLVSEKMTVQIDAQLFILCYRPCLI